MNVQWIKLKVDMFNDEKIKLIESLPDGDTILIVWIKLLAQAGKTNAKGYIFLNENVPLTDEMLSTIFNKPLQTLRYALQVLRNYGMIFIDENDFIEIANWEKHQNVEGLDQIRSNNAERQKRYRDKKKQALLIENNESSVTSNVTSRNSNALDKEIDKEIELDKDIKDINISSFNNDVENDFNEFWSLYPKKADKKKSFDKFTKLRKKYSLEIILNGTKTYLDYCKREKQFFKNPLTFLNGECFNDEYDLPDAVPGQTDIFDFDLED